MLDLKKFFVKLKKQKNEWKKNHLVWQGTAPRQSFKSKSHDFFFRSQVGSSQTTLPMSNLFGNEKENKKNLVFENIVN